MEYYQVIYSPQAVDDLKGIFSYIAYELRVGETAEKQVNRIREAIRSLNFMPERYGRVEWEPWVSLNMHKLPVDNYIIFYRVDSIGKTATVVRIFYGGRNIEEMIRSDNEPPEKDENI